MAATKRYNDRTYTYDSILDTEDREDYVYGSAAPERAPQRGDRQRRAIRRIDTSGHARRIRATSFSWGYVLFIMMTVALLLFGCIVGAAIAVVLISGFIPALRDYTMIMATTIFLASLMVIANLICDLLYKLVDPRIKFD